MNIEPDLLEAMVCKSGLGFVCGETGSGKSTLCSALYRYIMDNFPDAKIVTYEDPVEYILEMKTICSHRIRQKSGVMWSVLLPDCVLLYDVIPKLSVLVRSGITKPPTQRYRQATPDITA